MNIETLRQICLSFTSVTEDIKWEHDLCFCIGGKMFCVTTLLPEGGVSFKVRDDEFEEISARIGFQPAPYMSRAKWVMLTDTHLLSEDDWQFYIKQSYDLVKAKLPKKVQQSL
jgi:predicted DNA-binding protein (MmcQ/YjbR family)